MINGIYTIFDKVAMESGPLFEAKNDGVAQRQYSQFMETIQKQDKTEFKMLKLGSINHETNQIEKLSIPEEIIANLSMEEENE